MAQSESISSNVVELTVSELASALKRTLESGFGNIRVRGEITGYRGPHASGHAYFTLKDDTARLEAVVWRTTLARLKIKPQEGLEVVAAGRISTFAGRSTYQIVVENLEPAGVGALMALLESRRRSLAEEGLFDNARKRPLPFLPRLIGVITSPSGAVIHDILHRVNERFPSRLLLWPVRVQGPEAATEIAAAIRGMNALSGGEPIARPDVLIVARGGGSFEDLWPFNEEEVVRAAATSVIPLVSAVGHETDWTLIDHAADVRAPTPTAAAEFCLPLLSGLEIQLKRLNDRRTYALQHSRERRVARVRTAARGVTQVRSLRQYREQRADLAARTLKANMEKKLRGGLILCLKNAGVLARRAPASRLDFLSQRLHALKSAMRFARLRQAADLGERWRICSPQLRTRTERIFEQRHDAFLALTGVWRRQTVHEARRRSTLGITISKITLEFRRAHSEGVRRRGASASKLARLFFAFNVTSVVERGFAIILDKKGERISSAFVAKERRSLRIRFSDGEITVNASDVRRARTRDTSKQADLF